MYKVEIGDVFGKLVVVGNITATRWLCKCSCGNTKEAYASVLVKKNIKSCGCLKREATVLRNTTHNLSKSVEYRHWKGMLDRCYNLNNKRFNHYNGRGIKVHEDFRHNFVAWLKEIGNKPDGDGLVWSVGRIDNNGSYTYGNMRWELATQQARNHSKQVNNTSGIVGVQTRTRCIGGNFYTTFTACWNDLNTGKKVTKDFSADKFGSEVAKQMAIDYRNKKIRELNEAGAGYADSHGT